ncbi:FAD-dependent thymidylate synthase [Lachnoclostridium sp. An118]|uniref:FAD-dependent thymidylate synthase n=1 Tax=Lachnoclostridium sp. An118 TaxID=1965547 RepID=UPI001FA83D6E|nr:FAD-dependent thymidylate synthase [Lachnoclostridium sp. An118]
MEDLVRLYNRSFTNDTVRNMGSLPHPTIQKFTVITVAVVGASRRFLSQITRHQNEVKFTSASLQYSNYSGEAGFVKPYEILTAPPAIQKLYERSCLSDMDCYEQLCKAGISHDSAGYVTPQGLRNILIISATPFEWKHIIGQRSCRRNTDEMRIVILNIWQDLYNLSPTLFLPEQTGPFCQREKCLEGKLSCGVPISKSLKPAEISLLDYPNLSGGIDL